MQTKSASATASTADSHKTLVIAATFTADPLLPILAFWMDELAIPTAIELAPYNQVFQQLLDPFSAMAQNRQGVNIILFRLEDWRRELAVETQPEAVVQRNLQELIQAIQEAGQRSSTPYLVVCCPDSPDALANSDWRTFCQDQKARLRAELGGLAGLYLVLPEDFNAYPVADYYDAERDRLGHIPFTTLFYTALGTLLARRLYTLNSAPHKVIVLDCDNTLWKGVVGEDGVTGIEIPPPWQALQDFMVNQQRQGMLLCLCSKNEESDVLAVLEQRQDMRLKKEHLATWRINWLPKSQNLRMLAQELNLGLDSFIFIDDNPVECAEVQASCPEVLTLQLPVDGDIPTFLNHVWAFDHLKVTQEDQQRTQLYQQNLERDRLQKEALTFADFLAGLELTIEIAPPTPEQIPRVAQLTQRTNQFNFTTIRRSESDVAQLATQGLECRAVQVRDRFGDYGLVGVMIFGQQAADLRVDTFLLSCRVLGRGVEYRMLAYLGEVAQERHLNQVVITFWRTQKNLPALNFLEKVAADYQTVIAQGFAFSLPAQVAVAATFQPEQGEPQPGAETKPPERHPSLEMSPWNKSERLGQIARQWVTPAAIAATLADRTPAHQRDLAQPYIAPRSDLEQQLAHLWANCLHLDRVGITDNYFDLGGTSLLAVEIITGIAAQWGKKLPLTVLVEAPTVEQLAQRLSQTDDHSSLILIRPGGDRPPLFFIHDGDGETLLYRNLALRLSPKHPIYGLQPLADDQCPLRHTRIEDMAAYYREQLQQVQPQGPYFLAGMCAGGVIAFEVAYQLEQQGQTVGMLALLDAATGTAPKRVGRVAGQRLKSFSSVFQGDAGQRPWETLGHIARQVIRKVYNVTLYEVQSRLQRFHDHRQLLHLQRCLDQGLPLPPSLQHLSVRTIYVFAEASYQPTGPLQSEIVLFRAMSGEGADDPWIEVYSDPLFGWGELTRSGVRTFDIPGGHASMLQEPYVKAMAENMQAYINTVLGP